MLDLLIKSTVRLKLLGFFAINKGLEFYLRQAAKEVDESPHAVGLELKYPTKGGILKIVVRGTRKYYIWNSDSPYSKLLEEVITKMREEGDEMIRSIPDIRRRCLIEDNLYKLVNDIKKYYDPEKIVLFGSAASGKIGPYSDIDLVIIKKSSLPFFKRVQQLIDMLDYNIDVDFFVYTPEEFKRAIKERRFFKEEIIEKGEILYEKAA